MAAKPYGQVVVPTPGTPVRLTSNLPSPTLDVPAQAFLVQALPGNAGKVYLFQGGGNFTGIDDRTTLRRSAGFIAAPTDPIVGPFPSITIGQPVTPAALNLADYWIDADEANDGVIVYATVG